MLGRICKLAASASSGTTASGLVAGQVINGILIRCKIEEDIEDAVISIRATLRGSESRILASRVPLRLLAELADLQGGASPVMAAETQAIASDADVNVTVQRTFAFRIPLGVLNLQSAGDSLHVELEATANISSSGQITASWYRERLGLGETPLSYLHVSQQHVAVEDASIVAAVNTTTQIHACADTDATFTVSVDGEQHERAITDAHAYTQASGNSVERPTKYIALLFNDASGESNGAEVVCNVSGAKASEFSYLVVQRVATSFERASRSGAELARRHAERVARLEARDPSKARVMRRQGRLPKASALAGLAQLRIDKLRS